MEFKKSDNTNSAKIDNMKTVESNDMEPQKATIQSQKRTIQGQQHAIRSQQKSMIRSPKK